MAAPAPPRAALAGFGGSTAPTKNELIEFATTIVRNVGAEFGTRKIFRVVDQFCHSSVDGSGYAFFLYLTHRLEVSVERQRELLTNEDIRKVVPHPDPVGEHAVNCVMSQRGY